MSRGPGRVQRGILKTLERGPMDAPTLALHAGSSARSTGRALRTLRQGKAVCFLGFAGGGVGMWCLPEHEAEVRAVLLPDDLTAQVARLMGTRFARSLARSHLSMF